MARQSRDKIWDDFVHWCKKRHLKPMPAHPWTIAAFLRWMDSRNDGENAETALKSISRAHLLCGRRSPHSHPMITRTLGSIYRRRSSAPDRSDLFEARDFLGGPEKAAAISAHHRKDDIDPIDSHDEDEDADNDSMTPVPKRRAMRSQPRLVSKRRV